MEGFHIAICGLSELVKEVICLKNIEKVIAIGWIKIEDLSSVNSRKIKDIVRNKYSNYKEGAVNITTGQIFRFKSIFKGDADTYNRKPVIIT